MKKLLICPLLLLLFFSCKGLPKPADPDSSLVIGSIIWDFPDGFFQLKPRTIINNITLGFVNLTTSEQFKLPTYNGYFYFLCNGNDKFLLKYANYKSPAGPTIYTFGYELNLKIDTKPKTIIYIGQIKITFASPEILKAKDEDAMIKTSWRFREEYVIENKIEDLKKYITENDSKKLWQNYEIFNLYEK
jgi:hypothetical protein